MINVDELGCHAITIATRSYDVPSLSPTDCEDDGQWLLPTDERNRSAKSMEKSHETRMGMSLSDPRCGNH
jgi:hypothetical protein